MRPLLGKRRAQLPQEVYIADDPFVVLRHFDAKERELVEKAEQAFTARETATVLTAPPTPGVLDAIKALRRSGHTIIIVPGSCSSRRDSPGGGRVARSPCGSSDGWEHLPVGGC